MSLIDRADNTSGNNTWSNMNTWFYVLPPSRPSQIELERIKNVIATQDRDAPAAVLGSTPEFRDLLFEMKFRKIYVLEKNVSFYDKVSDLRVYDNEEVLLDGDWLSVLPRYSGFFSVVLSDLTMGNVPYADRKAFYESISTGLETKGLFIDKILTHSGKNISLEEIEDRYSALPLNLATINQFSCEALFCSELLDLKQIVDTTLFYRILENRFKGNRRLMAFIKNASLITPGDCIWFYGLQWESLKDSYYRPFSSFRTYEDVENSPYFKRAKHVIHVK